MTAAPIEVHYWASARSAAGVASDVLEVDGPITLAEVVRRALALHPGTRLPDVLQICSTLVGDRPVNSEDPELGARRARLHGRVPPAVRRRLSAWRGGR